jgi:hypothetical protein
MRKRISSQPQRESRSANTDWLDLEALARVEVTSEDAAHPIESALLPVGATGWRAESPGEQTVCLLFEAPQRLRRIRLLFREEKEARTQEFVLRWSPTADGPSRDRAPAVSLQPIGSHGGVRGISSRVGRRSRLRTHDHPEPEWRLIRLTGAIALGMTKDAVHFPKFPSYPGLPIGVVSR